MHTADDGLQVRVPVTAGAHEVSVSFVRRYWEPEGILQPPQRGFARTTNELYHGHPAVDNVAVAGPHRRRGAGGRDLARAAQRSSSASRDAGRGSAVRAADPRARGHARLSASRHRGGARRRCCAFYAAGRADGGFDAGIQRGLERMLAAPAFLFRVVQEPARAQTPGAVFPLSDLDLASRLSFFLWSSLPDEALRTDAARGRLREPGGAAADTSAGCCRTRVAGAWSTASRSSG